MTAPRDPFHRDPFGTADPDACATLPARVVRALGLWTHRGVRLDLAVLSALAHRHRVAHLPDGAWSRRVLDSPRVQGDPQLPRILDLAPGEFWVSAERVGRDLMARWRFADVAETRTDGVFGRPEGHLGFGPYPPPRPGPSGEGRFQKNVRNAVKRLETEGYVRRARTVQFDGQAPGAMGAVFTLDESLVPPGPLTSLPAPASLPLHPAGPDAALAGLLDGAGDGDPVPVVDVVGAALVLLHAFRRTPEGAASVKGFRERAAFDLGVRGHRGAEGRGRLVGAGRPASFLSWARRQARRGPGDDLGPDAERHVSVGAWAVEDGWPGPRPPGASYVVPWLVLDIDRGSDTEAAFGAAQRAVRDLLELGADPDDLLCCPTGGRGFHVHVPCGAFGTPLYRDADHTKDALRRLAAHVVDEDVDRAVLSPVHLVRAVGSGYHRPPPPASPEPASTAPPVGYKVRVPTAEFLGLRVDEAASRAQEFSPSGLPDPRRVRPVPALTAAAVRASYDPGAAGRRRGTPAGAGGKTDAVRDVEGGVEEGQRNNAAFVMATHFVGREHLGEDESWRRLQRWNAKNAPPLGVDELRGVFESALSSV